MDNKQVYLQGQYLPLSEAKVSVLDRGFLFGDGVYEVIPAYQGQLFQFAAHIERLNNSLKSIRLDVAYDLAQWQAILEPLLIEGDAQYIYLQITRGVAEKRDHAFPAQIEPTIFAMCSPIPLVEKLEGVSAITLDDMRWQLCNIKATTLLANVLLRQQAVEQNCAEAILIKDGYAIEGAASNLFIVLDNILITPPKNADILAGITREVIIQLAQDNNMACVEQPITETALLQASEIWLTSSTKEILPVIQLNNKVVGTGEIGTVWHRMNTLFQHTKRVVS